MKQYFTTKRDTNGNRYTLVIDHEKKTYSRGYNPFSYSDYIAITRKDRERMTRELDANGYKRED